MPYSKQTEIVKCNQCGEEYDDAGSIELAKKWIAEGYSPCPKCCLGKLEIKMH